MSALDPVIIWNTRDPLLGRAPVEFEVELRARLAGRVEAAYIFGSYGTADFGRDSDIDMMLVVKTDKPFLDRALDYPELFRLAASLDLLVYTPEEFASLTEDPSSGFWQSAVASMRRIL
jgi:predicted nucleotidyltransferase